MHAIVIHANISDLAEAERGLVEVVTPTVKRAPGFLGGYHVAVMTHTGSRSRCSRPRSSPASCC